MNDESSYGKVIEHLLLRASKLVQLNLINIKKERLSLILPITLTEFKAKELKEELASSIKDKKAIKKLVPSSNYLMLFDGIYIDEALIAFI